jgi:hypothetical protein
MIAQVTLISRTDYLRQYRRVQHFVELQYCDITWQTAAW